MPADPAAANRIDLRLTEAAAAGRGALLPYLTAAYPDASCTLDWIKQFDARGLAVVEIGFPYSDSIADGPVIQDSFNRALARGFQVDEAFELTATIRPQVSIGLVAMVSFSVVRRLGEARFMSRARTCGFDGLIVPDLPYEEAGSLAAAAAGEGLRHILMVAATTPPERAARIARLSSGFVYQVSSRGLTGERGRLPDDLRDRVAALRAAAGKPVCVGFGVGSAAQVRQVCAVADGVIVGSAIIRRINDALDAGETREAVVDGVTAFVDELAAGTL